MPQTIRTGPIEHWRVIQHDLGFHYNIAIIGSYSCPGSIINLSKQLLCRHLRDVISKHPALSAVVMGKDSPKPYFARLDKVDLAKVVSFRVPTAVGDKERAEWIEDLLSEQNSLGFDSDDLPLWRMVVFQYQEFELRHTINIAFVYHHAIGDGISGLAVHASILEALNSIRPLGDDELIIGDDDGDKKEATAVKTSGKPLLPPIEDILSMPMTTTAMMWNKLGPWIPIWPRRKSARQIWAGNTYHCETPIRTRNRLITIPAEATKSLAQRCRAEKTTITAFFQAIVGKVLVEIFKDGEWLRCAVAISLRRFFPPSLQIDDSVMGLWVDSFFLDYDRNELKGSQGSIVPWDVARKNSLRIQYEIGKGEKDLGVARVRNFKDFKAVLLDKIGKSRDNSYAITNIGLFDSKPAKAPSEAGTSTPWSISSLVFSQSAHVVGCAVQFCIVSTRGGGMSITLNWQEKTISDEDANRITNHLRNSLLYISEEFKT